MIHAYACSFWDIYNNDLILVAEVWMLQDDISKADRAEDWTCDACKIHA
jgi:hypothetical protein